MVPSSNNHLKNTAGGSFTKQTQGGTIIGLSTATNTITKAIQVKDVNQLDQTIYPGPKELSGAKTYNTQKILSAGTFAYNSNIRGANTYIISRVTTTLAGVAKTFLQFMGGTPSGPKFPYFISDHYDNTTTLIRKMQFSLTGWNTDGTKIKKRTTWITDPTGATPATADFGTSTQLPTRSVPGELFILTNFVDYNVNTSSNYYDYPAITGK